MRQQRQQQVGLEQQRATTPPTFNPAPEAKTLNFYNWTDYIADDTIPNFQKETGIKVTYDNYSSNDELFAKMTAGSTGYDIIVPTDAYAREDEARRTCSSRSTSR